MRRSLALLFVFGSCLTAIADDAKPGIPLRVAVDSTLKIASGNAPPVTVRAQVEFDYRLDRQGETVVSSVDRVSIMGESDGKELMFAEMDRSGMTTRRNGKVETMGRDGRHDAAFDQFGSPLIAIKVDAEGGEVTRESKVKPGLLATSNAVENIRLFHTRFPTKDDEWDAPAQFALGQGQLAKGTLHYKKRTGGRKDGLIDVDVTGKLVDNGKIGQAEITRGDYSVAGVQSYNPALREWVDGKLAVKVDFEALQPNGVVVKVSGPVTLTLSRVAPKKKAPKNP